MPSGWDLSRKKLKVNFIKCLHGTPSGRMFEVLLICDFFAALAFALVTMVAMSADWIGLRAGIWLVTTALGVYGVVLGVGHWVDAQAESQRRSLAPPARALRSRT